MGASSSCMGVKPNSNNIYIYIYIHGESSLPTSCIYKSYQYTSWSNIDIMLNYTHIIFIYIYINVADVAVQTFSMAQHGDYPERFL